MILEFTILLAMLAFAYRSIKRTDSELTGIPAKVADRLGILWDIVQQSMKDSKFLRAEKALLTILKMDQKNAAAYNRLGILYAKQREYKDSVDCFEIASTLEPSPSSFHNLGLVYYETGNYQKSAVAFEHALQLEDTLAARHIAYAKVQEKIGNSKKMITELERATELEPNPETFGLLAKAYQIMGMNKEAEAMRKKLSVMVMPSGTPKKVIRPKRVML